MDHKDVIIQDLKAKNKKLTEELKQLKKQPAAVETNMERLTGRDEHGNANYPYCFREDTCKGYGASSKCDDCPMTTKICEKLAQYEDLEEQGKLLIIDQSDEHPCKNCEMGWGSLSSGGSKFCSDTCEKLNSSPNKKHNQHWRR